MAKRRDPYLTVKHHRFEPPVYTREEIEGFKEQTVRLAKHIEILEEEAKNKRAQLIGLEKIILENS